MGTHFASYTHKISLPMKFVLDSDM